MPRVRGLRTDSTTRSRLGPELLAELRANLWAIDCQTCNRPLGWRKPSLTVAASDDGIAEAALHHRGCQKPRWESTITFPRFGLHQSWRSGGFAVRGEGLVVFLVNPACEVATLVSTETGWRLASLEGFLIAGMEAGWPDESPPLPGLTGSMDGGTLTIDFEFDGTTMGRWSTGSLPDYAAAEVRKRDLVLVGVTTAIDLTSGIMPEVVQSLVDRRQVALAWAKVTTTPGATDAPDATGPSDAVLTAVLAGARGDGSFLAALRGQERIDAVVQVAATFAALSPSEADQPDGAHIVIPDEPAGQRLASAGRPLLEHFGHSLVQLSTYGSPARADVVIGTPEQFAARSRGAQLAIVMDVPTGALPPAFTHHYERVLAI